jgi:hypothetical protein
VLVLEAFEYLGGLLCLLCGVFAARETGRTNTGALAARQVGVLWALAVLVAIVAGDPAAKLSDTYVVASVACTGIVFLIAGALVGMGLGAVGGLVGSNVRR